MRSNAAKNCRGSAFLCAVNNRLEAYVLSAERLRGDDTTTVPVLAKGKTDTGLCARRPAVQPIVNITD